MKKLCIYHSVDGHLHCDDGFGAAYAVWKRYGDDCEYYPAVYGQDPPNVIDREVIIVDFSYKAPVMRQILDQCFSLTMLDHHVTAEQEIRALTESMVPPFVAETLRDDERLDLKVWEQEGGRIQSEKAFIRFDQHKSGAVLAWEYLHGGPVPDLLLHIQDRDLWQFVYEGTGAVSAALRSYPHDFELWDRFVNAVPISVLIDEGDHINRFYQKKVEEALPRHFRAAIGGIVVPVINASMFMASDLATRLSGDDPFAACFSIGHPKVTFSLRSQKWGADVSEIAKMYGGGGHKHAAGFAMEWDEFIAWMNCQNQEVAISL